MIEKALDVIYIVGVDERTNGRRCFKRPRGPKKGTEKQRKEAANKERVKQQGRTTLKRKKRMQEKKMKIMNFDMQRNSETKS